MEPKNIPKTAVTTLLGLFEFVKTPFGLRSAAQSFQRFMDQVLYGLSFAYAYNIDDILIANPSPEPHVKDLKAVFQRLESYGIIISLNKGILGATELEFLGHHITQQVIFPLSEKVQAVQDFPQPELQSDTEIPGNLELKSAY